MRIFPLGESALTIEFGNEISPELHSKALHIAEYFERNQFPGFVESVPAYASATLFYDPYTVKINFAEFPSAFAAVKILVEEALEKSSGESRVQNRLFEIPLYLDEESALDLRFISDFSSLSPGEVIGLFLERTYRVYMLGFLPGFAYMGKVDERIAAPRKQSPRLKVPKGSVGIAGRQTGIYPLESPGGWQIIGRTEIEMFAPDNDIPCLLEPGCSVKFVRID